MRLKQQRSIIFTHYYSFSIQKRIFHKPSCFCKPSKHFNVFFNSPSFCTWISMYVKLYLKKKIIFIQTRFETFKWSRKDEYEEEGGGEGGGKKISKNVPSYTFFIRRSFNFNGSSSFECKVFCGVYCRCCYCFISCKEIIRMSMLQKRHLNTKKCWFDSQHTQSNEKAHTYKHPTNDREIIQNRCHILIYFERYHSKIMCIMYNIVYIFF